MLKFCLNMEAIASSKYTFLILKNILFTSQRYSPFTRLKCLTIISPIGKVLVLRSIEFAAAQSSWTHTSTFSFDADFMAKWILSIAPFLVECVSCCWIGQNSSFFSTSLSLSAQFSWSLSARYCSTNRKISKSGTMNNVFVFILYFDKTIS